MLLVFCLLGHSFFSRSLYRCPECSSSDDQCAYCFFIQVQDKQGDGLVVHVSKEARVHCPSPLCTSDFSQITQDMEPLFFDDDEAMFDTLLDRLGPMIGNWREVHNAQDRGEDKISKLPYIMLTIKSENIDNHDPVQHNVE